MLPFLFGRREAQKKGRVLPLPPLCTSLVDDQIVQNLVQEY